MTYLIVLCVGELQGQLGGLNVKGTNSGLCSLKQICPVLKCHMPFLQHPHSAYKPAECFNQVQAQHMHTVMTLSTIIS